METWFKEHVPSYYVFVDDSFQGFVELTDWTKVANQIVKEKAF